MSIIFALILVSLIVALGFLGAFFWATKHGQFEDGYTPSVRILFDDTTPKATDSTDSNISTPERIGASISIKEDE